MKVIPRKCRQLAPNEIRVININADAISELLWEVLMEYKSVYFDTADLCEDNIYAMNWDRNRNFLTYVVLQERHILQGGTLDFEQIRRSAGITTSSVFRPQGYKRLCITPGILRPDQKR